MKLIFVLGIALFNVLLASAHTQEPLPCNQGPQGQVGPKGYPGETGNSGWEGDPGKPANKLEHPPPGSQCLCPRGRKGLRGAMGIPGEVGDSGYPGSRGITGYKGEMGPKGKQGQQGPHGILSSQHPPSSPDILYVPVVIKGNVPRVVCRHFRRHAYVPGVPNNWLGWHEAGESGYLAFNKWLHYTTKFVCPCSVQVPPPPTLSPEMLRRLQKENSM